MVALTLDRQRLRTVIVAAGEELDGAWVLLGGALAALWFSPDRVTEDIDLVSVTTAPERRFDLMDFALSQGLPMESVNSAADFFLRRIPGWAQDLELMHKGSRAEIYRPTPTLFLLLKCDRMSESDLNDCLGLLEHTARCKIPLDHVRVIAFIDALPAPESAQTLIRRTRLRREIEENNGKTGIS